MNHDTGPNFTIDGQDHVDDGSPRYLYKNCNTFLDDRMEIRDEAASSSHLSEDLTWIDDYQCSICGFELPPSFFVERQEHLDFHIAEKLQKLEESVVGSSNSRLPSRSS